MINPKCEKIFVQVLHKYLNLLEINSKPQGVSKAVYLTCLAIQLLEKLGNKFPSQQEIDAAESMLKGYSSQKSSEEHPEISDLLCA